VDFQSLGIPVDGRKKNILLGKNIARVQATLILDFWQKSTFCHKFLKTVNIPKIIISKQ
jgi:hypothetical protein